MLPSGSFDQRRQQLACADGHYGDWRSHILDRADVFFWFPPTSLIAISIEVRLARFFRRIIGSGDQPLAQAVPAE